MSAAAHMVLITNSFFDDDWTPACSCGWEGRACKSMNEAATQADLHKRRPAVLEAATEKS